MDRSRTANEDGIFEGIANEDKIFEGIANEDKIFEGIAYCGVDCTACPDYKSKKCPGCRRSLWPDGDPCKPIVCCQEKGIHLCGACADFPCEMMKEFYQESDSHKKAYELMLSLRDKE